MKLSVVVAAMLQLAALVAGGTVEEFCGDVCGEVLKISITKGLQCGWSGACTNLFKDVSSARQCMNKCKEFREKHYDVKCGDYCYAGHDKGNRVWYG